MVTRSPFRARLCKPRDELWLGCIVKSKQLYMTRNGGVMFKIDFINFPFFMFYTEAEFERDRLTHTMLDQTPFKVGDSINVLVQWKTYDSNWLPSARIML